MTMYQTDPNPQPFKAASDIGMYGPCKWNADGTASPCTVDGEAMDFISNDDVAAGFGGGALIHGEGNYGLAGDAVPVGVEVCVKVSATDDRAKFIDVADAGTGDIVVGRCTGGIFSTGEDVADAFGAFHPSLAIRIYARSAQYAKPAP